MQLQIPLASKDRLFFKPVKGMTIQPIPGRKVPSHILLGWQTGMIYRVTPGSDTLGDELLIKGIVKGREFTTIEYSDNVQEKS